MYLKEYVEVKNLKYVTVYKFLQRNYSENLSKKNGKIWLNRKLINLLDNKYNPTVDTKLSNFLNKLTAAEKSISQLKDTVIRLYDEQEKLTIKLNKLLEENSILKDKVNDLKGSLEWNNTVIELSSNSNKDLNDNYKKLVENQGKLKLKINKLETKIDMLEGEKSKSIFKKLKG